MTTPPWCREKVMVYYYCESDGNLSELNPPPVGERNCSTDGPSVVQGRAAVVRVTQYQPHTTLGISLRRRGVLGVLYMAGSVGSGTHCQQCWECHTVSCVGSATHCQLCLVSHCQLCLVSHCQLCWECHTLPAVLGVSHCQLCWRATYCHVCWECHTASCVLSATLCQL